MKLGLFYTIMTFCLISNAYGSESDWRMSILRESMDNGSASTLGISSGDIFYAGLGLSYIESSTVIQYGNRKTIYPIYLNIGFRAPWKVSPYIEVGADLPEALLGSLLDELDADDENSLDFVDYYYSGGLEYSVNDMFSFALYVKKYKFKFRENSLAPISKARPHSYGIGVTIHF